MMKGYVKKQVLIDALNSLAENSGKIVKREVYDAIENAPEDEVTPTKECGEWTYKFERDSLDRLGLLSRRWYCSECGDYQTYGETEYCPNCGAKMRLSK